MKLTDQTTNLKLSKRLEELGVKQESLFYWEEHHNGVNELVPFLTYGKKDKPMYSAFSCSELGEMLPRRDDCISTKEVSGEWRCGNKIAETEANARAECLIYLLEQGLINKDHD